MSTAVFEPTQALIKPARLLPKRRKFVNEYIKTANAELAAKRAGYKPDNAAEQGRALLLDPEVRRSIESKLQKLDIKAENVLQETAKLAFSNMRDYLTVGEDGLPILDFTETTRDQWAAVGEYTEDATGGDNDGERRKVMRRKVKLQAKVQSLEMLAKHLHLLDQRVELDIGDQLAERLQRARSRTIDVQQSATPSNAQLMIDTHSVESSNQLVNTTQAYDDSFDTGWTGDDSFSSLSTSLPPSGGGEGGARYMENFTVSKVEDAGIIGSGRSMTIVDDSPQPDVDWE